MEAEILVIQSKIDEVPYECDEAFMPLHDEYTMLWNQMQDDNDAKIAALASWDQDDYELEDAVDQEAF